MIKIFGLRTIGITLVGISILYPLGVLLDTGESLNYILIGGAQNYALLRDISFILGIVLIIVSFFISFCDIRIFSPIARLWISMCSK